MELLRPFITLSLCCGLVLTLLPEGGLRRTAALVMGLIVTLCWMDGVLQLLELPAAFPTPAAALVQTGYSAGGE